MGMLSSCIGHPWLEPPDLSHGALEIQGSLFSIVRSVSGEPERQLDEVQYMKMAKPLQWNMENGGQGNPSAGDRSLPTQVSIFSFMTSCRS